MIGNELIQMISSKRREDNELAVAVIETLLDEMDQEDMAVLFRESSMICFLMMIQNDKIASKASWRSKFNHL